MAAVTTELVIPHRVAVGLGLDTITNIRLLPATLEGLPAVAVCVVSGGTDELSRTYTPIAVVPGGRTCLELVQQGVLVLGAPPPADAN